MDFALNDLQKLICHKTPNKQMKYKLKTKSYCRIHLVFHSYTSFTKIGENIRILKTIMEKLNYFKEDW